MATFTYNITSPGPADGSLTSAAHGAPPRSSVGRSAPAPASNAHARAPHSSPSDVADDPSNRREPTPPLPLEDREGNTSKELLNSDDSIEADPCLGEEHHIQAHRSEQVNPLILKLVYERDGDEMYQIVGWTDLQETWGTQEKPWKYSGSAEDPIIIDESMIPTSLPCGSDQFIAIPSLRRNIESVPGGYEVYVNMTLDDLQEHGGLELLAAYYFWNNKCRQTRSRGLCQH
ncbi:hypothetical protein ACJ73_01580 [Blastomyces percursus]|uniref:Uncharacterized protein n=1 Tax=Blastomyces percursus TaxID=1658174 RepID=A0A1J9R3S6_9EURO|nr:hypothetical protein ACJ73_01580 [Blastomyces percursus]